MHAHSMTTKQPTKCFYERKLLKAEETVVQRNIFWKFQSLSMPTRAKIINPHCFPIFSASKRVNQHTMLERGNGLPGNSFLFSQHPSILEKLYWSKQEWFHNFSLSTWVCSSNSEEIWWTGMYSFWSYYVIAKQRTEWNRKAENNPLSRQSRR